MHSISRGSMKLMSSWPISPISTCSGGDVCRGRAAGGDPMLWTRVLIKICYGRVMVTSLDSLHLPAFQGKGLLSEAVWAITLLPYPASSTLLCQGLQGPSQPCGALRVRVPRAPHPTGPPVAPLVQGGWGSPSHHTDSKDSSRKAALSWG